MLILSVYLSLINLFPMLLICWASPRKQIGQHRRPGAAEWHVVVPRPLIRSLGAPKAKELAPGRCRTKENDLRHLLTLAMLAALGISLGAGWIAYLVAGFIGACILIWVGRLVRR